LNSRSIKLIPFLYFGVISLILWLFGAYYPPINVDLDADTMQTLFIRILASYVILGWGRLSVSSNSPFQGTNMILNVSEGSFFLEWFSMLLLIHLVLILVLSVFCVFFMEKKQALGIFRNIMFSYSFIYFLFWQFTSKYSPNLWNILSSTLWIQFLIHFSLFLLGGIVLSLSYKIKSRKALDGEIESSSKEKKPDLRKTEKKSDSASLKVYGSIGSQLSIKGNSGGNGVGLIEKEDGTHRFVCPYCRREYFSNVLYCINCKRHLKG